MIEVYSNYEEPPQHNLAICHRLIKRKQISKLVHVKALILASEEYFSSNS